MSAYANNTVIDGNKEGESTTAQHEEESTTAGSEGESTTAQPDEGDNEDDEENEETLNENYWLALLEYNSGSDSSSSSENDKDQARGAVRHGDLCSSVVLTKQLRQHIQQPALHWSCAPALRQRELRCRLAQ